MILYHGTNSLIKRFRLSKSIGTHGEKDQLEGIYLTDNLEVAQWYADGPNYVLEVEVEFKNPFKAKSILELKNVLGVYKMKGVRSKLIKIGYDSIILDIGFYTLGAQTLYLAFHSKQVKIKK